MLSHPRYFSKKQLYNKVYRLNALHAHALWFEKTAYREHIDCFGKSISPGQNYYRLRIGNHRSQDLKLSKQSMDRFVYVLFTSNPELEVMAKDLAREKFAKMRKMVNSLLDWQNASHPNE